MSNDQDQDQKIERPLNDVTIIFAMVAYDDDGYPYATTSVHRYDYEGDVKDLITHLEKDDHIIHGGQMHNEQD